MGSLGNRRTRPRSSETRIPPCGGTATRVTPVLARPAPRHVQSTGGIRTRFAMVRCIRVHHHQRTLARHSGRLASRGTRKERIGREAPSLSSKYPTLFTTWNCTPPEGGIQDIKGCRGASVHRQAGHVPAPPSVTHAASAACRALRRAPRFEPAASAPRGSRIRVSWPGCCRAIGGRDSGYEKPLRSFGSGGASWQAELFPLSPMTVRRPSTQSWSAHQRPTLLR